MYPLARSICGGPKGVNCNTTADVIMYTVACAFEHIPPGSLCVLGPLDGLKGVWNIVIAGVRTFVSEPFHISCLAKWLLASSSVQPQTPLVSCTETATNPWAARGGYVSWKHK